MCCWTLSMHLRDDGRWTTTAGVYGGQCLWRVGSQWNSVDELRACVTLGTHEGLEKLYDGCVGAGREQPPAADTANIGLVGSDVIEHVHEARCDVEEELVKIARYLAIR